MSVDFAIGNDGNTVGEVTVVRTLIPFRESGFAPLEDLYKEFDHLVQNFLGNGNEEGRNNVVGPRLLAPVNLAETEAGYEVTVDLPGVKAEEVNVEVNDGQLTISGERKSEEKQEGKTYHRVERRYGAFRRVVNLPASVDEAKISAQYTDGVLRIHLPKSEKVKPTRIQVSAPGTQAS